MLCALPNEFYFFFDLSNLICCENEKKKNIFGCMENENKKEKRKIILMPYMFICVNK